MPKVERIPKQRGHEAVSSLNIQINELLQTANRVLLGLNELNGRLGSIEQGLKKSINYYMGAQPPQHSSNGPEFTILSESEPPSTRLEQSKSSLDSSSSDFSTAHYAPLFDTWAKPIANIGNYDIVSMQAPETGNFHLDRFGGSRDAGLGGQVGFVPTQSSLTGAFHFHTGTADKNENWVNLSDKSFDQQVNGYEIHGMPVFARSDASEHVNFECAGDITPCNNGGDEEGVQIVSDCFRILDSDIDFASMGFSPSNKARARTLPTPTTDLSALSATIKST